MSFLESIVSKPTMSDKIINLINDRKINLEKKK